MNDKLYDRPEQSIHESVVNQKGAKIAENAASSIFDALHTDLIPGSISDRGFESAIEIDEGMKTIFDEADTIRKKYESIHENKNLSINPKLRAAAGAITAVFYKYSPGNKVNMETRLRQFEGNQVAKASDMIKNGLAVCADKASCAKYFQTSGFDSSIVTTNLRDPSTKTREKHASVLVNVDGEDYMVDPHNPDVVGENSVYPAVFPISSDLSHKIRNNLKYDTGELKNIVNPTHTLRYSSAA